MVLAEVGLMLLGFAGGFVGSTVLWLTIGRRIVAQAVLTRGREMVQAWVREAVVDNPDNGQIQIADPDLKRLMQAGKQQIELGIGAGIARFEKAMQNAFNEAGQAVAGQITSGESPLAGSGLSSLLSAIPGAGSTPSGQLGGLASIVQLMQLLKGGGNNSGGGWKE